MHACSVTSVVWLSVTPWTVAHQAPLSVGTLQARILEWVAMFSPRILLYIMLLFSRSGWPYIFSLSLECMPTCGYVFVWGFLICLFGFGIYAGWCSQSFFFKKFIFKEQFRYTVKSRGKYRGFLCTAWCPHPHMGSLLHSQPHSSGCTLFTKDEPSLTGHNHPRSTVYLRMHSCCCSSVVWTRV